MREQRMGARRGASVREDSERKGLFATRRPDEGASEVSEEMEYGQIVIIVARWVLIACGFVLAFWQPEPVEASQLRLTIVILMVYSIGNFFLTIQWMRKSVLLEAGVYLTSLADLTVITVLIAATGSQNLFVFYFPAGLAFAVTFPRALTVLYGGGVLFAYAATFVAMEVEEAMTTAQAQDLAVRLIVLAAVVFCGSLYQSIESDRRSGKGRMYELLVGFGTGGRGDGRSTLPAQSATEARADG